MARIGPAPETYHALPPDFAAALGQSVAAFGWLEEILKRTLYALDRARLADDLSEAELQHWLDHIGQIADDSLGTLIEQLDAAMRRHPGLQGRDRITARLSEAKLVRNLLCHASWRPTDDPARWHPACVGTRGRVHDNALSLRDLERIRQDTIEMGLQVLHVMRATGIAGYWAGDDED